jgi:uncharacterized protein YndB with AHSA1/START domain
MDMEVKQLAVRKTITVDAPIAHVFRTFTVNQNAWWPRGHHIGKCETFTAIVEPRAGGRWFERGDDGSECDWGRVLVWDEPNRVVLCWSLDADWRYDADLRTEVDVRFVAETPRRTRVELEHRGLERFGDKAEQMRTVFDSPDAWAGGLALMRDCAEKTLGA